MEKVGKYAQQRNYWRNRTQIGIPRGIRKNKNLPERSETQHKQHQTNTTGGGQNRIRNTGVRWNRKMSSDSDNTIAVPAINFKLYLRDTGVRYINMETCQYNWRQPEVGPGRNTTSGGAEIRHKPKNNNEGHHKRRTITENNRLPRKTDTGTYTRWIQRTSKTSVHKIWHRIGTRNNNGRPERYHHSRQ